MSDVIEVPVLPDEPGRPPLDAVINAQIGLEKWQRRTRLLQWLLVPVSAAMAYRLFAGFEGRTVGVNLLLCAWFVTFLGLCVCAEAGWRSHKRLDRMLSGAGGRRR